MSIENTVTSAARNTMDKRALDILLKSYWSSSGWKPDNETTPSPEDFEYAKSKGLMFDPVDIDRDQGIAQLIELVAALSRRRVADAFLASLSTRRLDWRSAMGSFAVFQHIQRHAAEEMEGECRICGAYLTGDDEQDDDEQDLNVLNFERFKWGGVRHDQVVYAAFDLRQFLKESSPQPTAADIEIFRRIISAIDQAPQNTSSANLHAEFAKVLKSNKSERDVLVAILGFSGILETPEHPGYSSRFILAGERSLPDQRFVKMAYPACWWRGDIGINQLWLSEYFAHVL